MPEQARTLARARSLSALARRAARARAGSTLPWARPRYELTLLCLVALVALLPVPSANPQDVSRICLASALLDGRLSNDACLAGNTDYASYDGHLYSDKAPGVSLLELPSVALLQPIPFGASGVDVRLWAVRALSVGLSLLLLAFCFGRVSEGLAPGYGAAALASFGLGTIAVSLVQISFEEVPTAAALFAAFLLAWGRKPLAAGLLAGAALLLEYESGLGIVLIGGYVALAGRRELRRYALGVLPGALLLGAYDWAAFGAPWHLSYRYVSQTFAAQQGKGFFGIGTPSPAGLFALLGDNGGLLFVSPVLALSAYGLWRLRRTRPAELALAAALTLVMALVEVGYYLPYGGTSPGPRFFAPALPFLAFGLSSAFAWRPRLTLWFAVASIATTTAIGLVWADGLFVMRQTVWGEIVRIPFERSHAPYVEALAANLLGADGLGRALGVALVIAAAAAATLLLARSLPARVAAVHATHRPARRIFLSGLAAWALAALDVCAVYGYPYGNGYQPRLTPAEVQVAGTPVPSYVGGDVNLTITVTNESDVDLLSDIVLRVSFGPGMSLVGPPKSTIGPGCPGSSGASGVVCPLGYLAPGQPGTVYFGVQLSQPGNNELSASVSSDGFPGPKPTVFSFGVGN